MATPNVTTAVLPAFDSLSAIRLTEYSPAWLVGLTEPPTVDPTAADTLQTHINQAVHEWLMDNAPAEICELMNAAGSMQQYVREYEFTKGGVSKNANETIGQAVADAFKAAGSIGLCIVSEE